MVEKKLSICFSKNGNGYTTTKICIPYQWLKEMNVSKEDRQVKVTYNDKKIIIEKEG